jgi:hypothetical protein
MYERGCGFAFAGIRNSAVEMRVNWRCSKRQDWPTANRFADLIARTRPAWGAVRIN